MLDSTIFELISIAASNSLMVFCFCNLIIAVLLVGSSSKPSSQFNEVDENQENFNKTSVSLSEQSVVLVEGAKELSSVSVTMVDNETMRPSRLDNADDDVDDDDGDLKRRVEEFIEKINKGWRAEKVRSYALGQ
ncbi:uncharacterized protein LOC110011311 [Sesamum indicum]|uniref:Uncharacterized protein LOC110011311 n=1 Tax=Sesamum indicum TaxID=4182 RepID=A0A8M8USV5_SESIN|nr:uncharacterized protein LOC110011311 [Sesamum indicum]